MEPFRKLEAVAAPLLRINIDTDAIAPSRELKAVSKTGMGAGLFANWRYLDPKTRTPNPDFILNRPAYRNTQILLAGANFGCGSSREYAVWALKEYGIRAIIAPSFGSIFYNNCIRNGLLPIRLDEKRIRQLAEQVAADPQANRIAIDLESCTLRGPDGETDRFAIADQDHRMLLDGLDPIGLTLTRQDEIAAFEGRD
ncbi:MAG: 3-isopropylmalate dehydratase small subunit, partial [Alphaproteobacteria bacterium]